MARAENQSRQKQNKGPAQEDQDQEAGAGQQKGIGKDFVFSDLIRQPAPDKARHDGRGGVGDKVNGDEGQAQVLTER